MTVYRKTNDETIINCCGEESADKAYDILEKKLSGTCKIVKEQIIKPKIEIVGIHHFENMDIKNYKKITMK